MKSTIHRTTSRNYIELEDGTFLISMGDGRYHVDGDDRRQFTVRDERYIEGSELQ